MCYMTNIWSSFIDLLKSLSNKDVKDEKAKVNDSNDGVRQRTRAAASGSTSNGLNDDYTQEQVDAVRRLESLMFTSLHFTST
mgnify:CR=1 FL=1